MADLRLACERESPRLLDLTRALVQCESPSTDPQALEACATLLAARLADAGAAVARLPGGHTADHVRADWPGAGPRVLLLGHFDTVWPIGQIDRMPIHEQDGKLFGPGVLDMKAGLAIAITAASVVYRSLPPESRPHVTMLATSDEEVGSASSRAAIEALARESQAVLVFEPALPGGAVKTARKGVGEFEIAATGVSAHAGANPLAGASAIHAMARLITTIEALNDPARGLTVNVGVVDGGTRSNVVAERARALVDVRIARLADAATVTGALAALRAHDPRVTVTVSGGINRPPMERTDAVATLYGLARDVAAGLEMPLEEGATGGASDGNFTAALGVPTLDGLGALGDGPHALHEHVIVDALRGRATLAAGILARLAQVR